MVQGMSDDLQPHWGAVLCDLGPVPFSLVVARAVGQHGASRHALHRCLASTAGMTPAEASRLGRCTGTDGVWWLILQRDRTLAETGCAVGVAPATRRSWGDSDRGFQSAAHGRPTGVESSLARRRQTLPSSRRAPAPTPR